MKPSVYVETSVISYLTGRPSRDVIVAGRQALTSEWWDTCRDRFDLYVSPLVVTEAEDGDPAAVARRLAAIQGIPALAVGDDVEALARRLVEDGPMPKEYPEDALHIAVCAVNGVDYLVTWNATHLTTEGNISNATPTVSQHVWEGRYFHCITCVGVSNATMRRQVERFLEEAGYACPVICTPEELMEA